MGKNPEHFRRKFVTVCALQDAKRLLLLLFFVPASVMAKKAAEGIEALCLQVTFGKAAFIPTREDAEALAKLMV